MRFEILVKSGSPGMAADQESLLSLYDDLRLALPTGNIEARPSDVPAGAKSATALSLTDFILTLGSAGGLLTTLVAICKDWLMRQQGHSIVITQGADKIEITGPSTEEQRRLVDAWIERHEA